MPKHTIQDKMDQPIQEGDYAFTRVRGGSHHGKVQKIVTDEEEAEQEDVKNPPKVIYSDQHGHQVARNPETLEKTQPEE
ncbi:hypothetical protein ASPVEDRAFT_55292 [Aspergillus versicolor CBS 583.65]|uniref:Hypervirulence associated protein TUDOR domain-containing protein n=1 Tax=Aspergillus versicolor CBS 583.65 TaxID=1036611 RepID=A0A1L9PV14_ASPVE|nr:uncharacterized protein ASPVEDRAFT_55292 [Aspergillus versicolor CBS 583.65]OJJ05389.1 hypothetical protein ASPVEDRAFT_55292 [Aspergillus versicolor CBS 583.65]